MNTFNNYKHYMWKLLFQVLVNYVMNILCLTFASLQFSVTGWAIGECISTNPDAAIKCEPYTTVNVVLGIIVISLGVILFITCLIGTIFFCIYARSFGFVNHYGTMQKQIDTLRKQLDERESNNHVKKAYEAFGSKGPWKRPCIVTFVVVFDKNGLYLLVIWYLRTHSSILFLHECG